MDGWTPQRVLALAPDPASAKAGQGLATARKWSGLGFDDRAAWGECQGSGAKPYQVQVELAEPAFKCSCPSRKFPCKHGIGLMLLVAADAVARAERPGWVEQWLASRSERAEKRQARAEAPPKPVDEAAQAKRREKRFDRVSEGLDALRLWVEDLVRGGVAAAPARGYDFHDEQARRMVDAQAPGVAHRVRSLAALASAGAGWQRAFVEALASIHLLILAYERLGELSESARDGVLDALGFARPQEEVLARPPVRDRWQVLARETAIEDRLRVRRTWLYGPAARRPALVLAFSHAAAPPDDGASLAPGVEFDGELCFYPGNATRAALKSREDVRQVARFDSLGGLDALCDVTSDLRAGHPWLDEVAAPVRAVTPVRRDDGWALVDAAGLALPARVADAVGWQMLALSGGRPVDVALAYDFARVRPLAMTWDGGYAPLSAGEEGADG